MKEFSVNMEVIQNQDTELTNKTDSIPPEPTKKHPLEHKWTLWFYENNKRNNWLDNLHNVYTFDSVEDFWCLHNHIKPIHSFGPGNDYALFKEGVQPMWEDPKNKQGGKWLVTLESMPKPNVADLWLHLSCSRLLTEDRRGTYQTLSKVAESYLDNTRGISRRSALLFMIGESFGDCSDEICGAYINIRGKHDKINLWTSDATKNPDIENIGHKLKYECLNLPDVTFTYESHEGGPRKGGSRGKPGLLYI